MRSFFRKTALVLSLGSLLFFLSCERHRVGELPDQIDKTVATEETHSKSEHDSKSDQAPAMMDHAHMSQTPAPRNSPANFFPDKQKP